MPHVNWSHKDTGTPGSIDAQILEDRSQPWEAWYVLFLDTNAKSTVFYDPKYAENVLRELGYYKI